MEASAAATSKPVGVAVEVPDCPLRFGEHLRMVGDCEELGAWDATAAPSLVWQEGHSWVGELSVPPGPHSFKLVVLRGDGGQYWEEGENRTLLVPVPASAATSPAVRAVCRFGATADTSVTELAPAKKQVGDRACFVNLSRSSTGPSLRFVALMAAQQHAGSPGLCKSATIA
jgi:hypothetical protein